MIRNTGIEIYTFNSLRTEHAILIDGIPFQLKKEYSGILNNILEYMNSKDHDKEIQEDNAYYKSLFDIENYVHTEIDQ